MYSVRMDKKLKYKKVDYMVGGSKRKYLKKTWVQLNQKNPKKDELQNLSLFKKNINIRKKDCLISRDNLCTAVAKYQT